MYVCFGEEETSVNNSARGKNLVERPYLKLSEKQIKQTLTAALLAAPTGCPVSMEQRQRNTDF